MGNTGKAFLTATLTLFLPLIIFVNLLAFGNLFGFEELQANGDVYFGYSSILESFKLFENLMSNEYFRYFDMEHVTDNLRQFTSVLLGGWPRFLQYFSNLNNKAPWDINVDWSTIPKSTAPTWTPTDVLQAVKWLVQFFQSFPIWLNDLASWMVNNFKGFYEMVLFTVTFMFQPLFVIYYLVYFAMVFIYWIVLFLFWLVALFNGRVTQPMPSNNYSSWQEIADDWMDNWSSLPTSSAKVLFAPFDYLVHGGIRGDILAI